MLNVYAPRSVSQVLHRLKKIAIKKLQGIVYNQRKKRKLKPMIRNVLKKSVKYSCFYLFFGATIWAIVCSQVERKLVPGIDAYMQLREFRLASNELPLRLHLGCGQQYLQEYVNVDYPLIEHTVQSYSVADVFGDIAKITFMPKTVDEIRLHHVFEHFDRPTAIALLCAWHMWLKPGGLLYIEVPDFLTSAKMMFDDNYS